MKKLFTLLLITPFFSNAQFVRQGICTQSGNVFTLNGISQSPYAGRFFNTTPLSLNSNFDLVFTTYAGNTFNNGFAFVLIPGGTVPTAAYPPTVINTDNIHNFGTGSIATDFVIEFDIRGSFCVSGQNTNYEPVTDVNHVSYWKNNSSCTFGNYYSPFSALGTINYYTYEPYRIKWTKATNTLETYYNNVLVKSNVVDLVGLLGTNAFWGFSAGCYCVTGGPSINLQSMNGGAILPLTVISFTAEKNNNTVKLNWQTAQEQNASHFVVEKSVDGNNFSELQKVMVSGNSNIQKNYKAVDAMPLYGTNFYRLKMVDLDGSFSYSKIVAVKLDSKNYGISIFPNPVGPDLRFQLTSTTTKEKAIIKIADVAGRILYEQPIQLNAAVISSSIDVSGLGPGIYQLLLQRENGATLKQFIKQ